MIEQILTNMDSEELNAQLGAVTGEKETLQAEIEAAQEEDACS